MLRLKLLFFLSTIPLYGELTQLFSFLTRLQCFAMFSLIPQPNAIVSREMFPLRRGEGVCVRGVGIEGRRWYKFEKDG